MPHVDCVVHTDVKRTFRCRQIESLFDVPATTKLTRAWKCEVPIEQRDWNVGLIVGPSGAGKTIVAKQMFGNDALNDSFEWGDSAVADSFEEGMSVEKIGAVFSSVGFNTVPSWLKPFSVLSNGEKFRVTIARKLLSKETPIVVDEFSSVVDRQVAKIVSNSVQKYVRKNARQFVAVSCHYDIIDWLQPDWVFEPHEEKFTWRSLQRRPRLDASISPIPHSAWRVFSQYHYMSSELHKAARCHGLFIGKELVGFGGVLFRPLNHKTGYDIYGLSRLVVLPDWQGLGLAFHLMNALGSIYLALGHKFHMYPAHPSFVRSMKKDKTNWRLIQEGSKKFGKPLSKKTTLSWLLDANAGIERQCSVFRYIGPAIDKQEAKEYMSFWDFNKMVK